MRSRTYLTPAIEIKATTNRDPVPSII